LARIACLWRSGCWIRAEAAERTGRAGDVGRGGAQRRGVLTKSAGPARSADRGVGCRGVVGAGDARGAGSVCGRGAERAGVGAGGAHFARGGAGDPCGTIAIGRTRDLSGGGGAIEPSGTGLWCCETGDTIASRAARDLGDCVRAVRAKRAQGLADGASRTVVGWDTLGLSASIRAVAASLACGVGGRALGTEGRERAQGPGACGAAKVVCRALVQAGGVLWTVVCGVALDGGGCCGAVELSWARLWADATSLAERAKGTWQLDTGRRTIGTSSALSEVGGPCRTEQPTAARGDGGGC
jgi:hypothetical protein